ncbi:hypothetical protein COO60DRAFT_973879 [Scenedesmus sp. NREL 46B-D3]|nr:hypothetical protein COO60DRAFT_973879 [Scenedesmus sp. NREL 46B-D3]
MCNCTTSCFHGSAASWQTRHRFGSFYTSSTASNMHDLTAVVVRVREDAFFLAGGSRTEHMQGPPGRALFSKMLSKEACSVTAQRHVVSACSRTLVAGNCCSPGLLQACLTTSSCRSSGAGSAITCAHQHAAVASHPAPCRDAASCHRLVSPRMTASAVCATVCATSSHRLVSPRTTASAVCATLCTTSCHRLVSPRTTASAVCATLCATSSHRLVSPRSTASAVCATVCAANCHRLVPPRTTASAVCATVCATSCHRLVPPRTTADATWLPAPG